MKKHTFKFLVICTFLGIINTQAADSYALLRTQKHTLSPAISINQENIKNIIGNLKDTPVKINTFSEKANPFSVRLKQLRLDELSDIIIERCQRNDFSLLKLDWDKNHYDYQQFIKEAAAINTAINHLIFSEDVSEDMDYALFLEKAVNARIEMMKKYQAPLSEKGLKSIFFISRANSTIELLRLLMNPPKEWFEPLFDHKRKEVLLRECVPPLLDSGTYDPTMDTPRIVATWGCSTQCDHCDGAAVIEIKSFPWIWIQESQALTPKYISRINLAPYHNDHFRDYYDIVYDKDASHIYKLLNREITSTSGFAPGSVGERALKRVLKNDKMGLFQISIAPSAWMRSVIQKHGVEGYLNYLKNIENMFYNAGVSSLLQYAIFNFHRIDDPPELITQIIKFCQAFNKSTSNGSIHVSGRYVQLESNGEINSINTKNNLNRISDYPDEQDKRTAHFLFADLKKYFLLPDGQLIRGTNPNESTLMRNYQFIPGLESIGRRKINCLMCQSPNCNGKPNTNCIGRSKVFKYLGLSASGGFKNTYLEIENSI